MAFNGLVHAIGKAIKLSAPTLRKASIHLELDLAEDLPHIYGDLQLLEQVFLNLISNACAALGHTKGARWIRMTSLAHRGSVIVHIEDSGPGIPPELRGRVFDPFFTTESQGTGIGLGICKHIVSDHRGEITFTDSPLGGTRFTVSIPVEKPKRAW